MKRGLWNVHHPGHIRSPVTIQMASPECRGSFRTSPPTGGEHPDPRAKEAELKALSQCEKGKMTVAARLWFGTTTAGDGGRAQSTGALREKGAPFPLVPRPAPLPRGQRCPGEDTAATLSAAHPDARTPPARPHSPSLSPGQRTGSLRSPLCPVSQGPAHHLLRLEPAVLLPWRALLFPSVSHRVGQATSHHPQGPPSLGGSTHMQSHGYDQTFACRPPSPAPPFPRDTLTREACFSRSPGLHT